MLRVLRKRENLKMIMWILAILIIPAFVLWGSGSAIRSKGRPKYAGKIFGKKVSFRQYEATLLAARNQALLIYGDDFDKVSEYLNLQEQAWERLILLYQAKKERLKVSNEEVINIIKTIPFFQEAGRFDQHKYNILLEYVFQTTPREFEEQIRDLLKIEKLKTKVTLTLNLTDQEIEKAYKSEQEKAKAVYVLIEPQNFKEQVHPTYAELEQYYQLQKSRFEKPEQVNVEYLGLYFEPARPEGEISEEERTSLEEKIWQISDEIGEDPESFEQAAEKFQLAVKQTGFFAAQGAIPGIGLSYEFSRAAFSLNIGQISNIIETPKGYFIIKVKEKKDAYIPTLEEAKEEVRVALTEEQSWQLAQAEAEQLLVQIKEMMQKENLTFSKAAQKLSLSVKETEEFSRLSYISGIGQSQEFTQAAFELKEGEVSPVIAVPSGYAILSLKGLVPIDEEKFAQEKEEFAERLLARRKEIYFKVWTAKLKQKANLISHIDKLKNQPAP